MRKAPTVVCDTSINKTWIITVVSIWMSKNNETTRLVLCADSWALLVNIFLVLLFFSARHAPYFSAYFFSSLSFSTTFPDLNWSTPHLLPCFSRPSWVSPSQGSILQLPFWTKNPPFNDKWPPTSWNIQCPPKSGPSIFIFDKIYFCFST